MGATPQQSRVETGLPVPNRHKYPLNRDLAIFSLRAGRLTHFTICGHLRSHRKLSGMIQPTDNYLNLQQVRGLPATPRP